MFQGIFKSALNDANKNYIFGTGSIPIQIKSAQLVTFADGTTKQQGYQVAEVNKLISTMLTGWSADGNKPKSMSDNYLELILSCDNGFVVKKRLQFPHIIAWKDDSAPYNIADIYKEFSVDNWLKADDFENPDITLVVEPTDEILTTSTATPPEATTAQSGRFYLYYRNLPVGINRVHIEFHIKAKTEPIDFDLEVTDGLSLKDAQVILASNNQAKINVLLSGVKDVYKFTGSEGDFENITMHEWSTLYQQIISLKPNNKFTHDLYFYVYDESELNTKITELEYDINNIDFSDLKGKVTANMMEGYEKGNIFSSAELYKEGYYVTIVNGHIVTMKEDSFNIYILPVDALSKYTFTNVRFALPLADDKYTAISETLIQNIKTIDMALYSGIKYIAFSFNKEVFPLSSYIVSKGDTLREGDIYPTWINEAIYAKIREKKVPFLSNTKASLIKNQSFVLRSSRTNLRKGMRVVATADVSGTGGFELGFSIIDSSVQSNHNTIVISDTQAKFAKNGYTYEDRQDHGLTISGKIAIIFEYNDNGTATYTILANGKSFKHTIDFLLQSISAPYLISNGATLTDCKITLSCTDIDKKIWCFGDSYFAYSAARWTYYLQEYGYAKNVLLDGFPGEGGVNGNAAFKTLLSMGNPKYAIWFLGMNDGSDPNDSTPSTDWASHRDIFLSLCNQHEVTPVFATIPNVPSINHKGKNAWIKASGYRYIDMCHAVGADADVNWLGTMLSSDNIHPSEDGARALFAQVIQDFPEIMVEL